MASGAPAKNREVVMQQNGGRSPLAQLLHALNQPLTGLQCSLELSLTGVRTPEQYRDCLRTGLELTERMRTLLAATRELVDIEEQEHQAPETVALATLLGEIVAELQPVANEKDVRVLLSREPALTVTVGRRSLTEAVFRLLESALSLAAPGSRLSVEVEADREAARVRVGWSREKNGSHEMLSPPELGLMLALTSLRKAGGQGTREQTQDADSVTLRLPLEIGAGG
jgi:signal transduction histidine kinase